jgi:hypothetical protein
MATQKVAVELPQAIFQQLTRIALATQQPLEVLASTKRSLTSEFGTPNQCEMNFGAMTKASPTIVDCNSTRERDA